MVVAHVDHVGTSPLQGEDFGEDQHGSGGSHRAAPGADGRHARTLHG